MSNYAPTRDGGHYFVPSNLLFFQQLNIAACAARRARQNVIDNRRWSDEYDTARFWARKNVMPL
jgi:hypothetical protein